MRGPEAHYNLYNDEGLLFTHDHIIPTSRGGTNTLDNSQTLCEKCNSIKGNRFWNLKEVLTVIDAATGEQIQGIVVMMEKNSVTLEQFMKSREEHEQRQETTS